MYYFNRRVLVARRILILGVPGVGKTTYARRLAAVNNIPCVTAPEMFQQPNAEIALESLRKGNVIPCAEMHKLMSAHIRSEMAVPGSGDGYVLDGYPTTVAQAVMLDSTPISVTKAYFLRMPYPDGIKKLSSRRTCEKCKRVQEGQPSGMTCEVCSGRVMIRPEDEEQTVRLRLQVFDAQIEPLRQYYASKGVLVEHDVQASSGLKQEIPKFLKLASLS